MDGVIWMVRHGESTSNAGERTQDVKSIPLTKRGHEQAKVFADGFLDEPDILVTSSYVRATLTAWFLADRFPKVPLEIWDVHEFTYLDADKYRNTTHEERKAAVEAYWDRNDPGYRDGDGFSTESFRDFLERCRNFLKRCLEHPKKRIVVFTHGQFMQACKGILDGGLTSMAEHHQFQHDNPVPNCQAWILTHYLDTTYGVPTHGLIVEDSLT